MTHSDCEPLQKLPNKIFRLLPHNELNNCSLQIGHVNTQESSQEQEHCVSGQENGLLADHIWDHDPNQLEELQYEGEVQSRDAVSQPSRFRNLLYPVLLLLDACFTVFLFWTRLAVLPDEIVVS